MNDAVTDCVIGFVKERLIQAARGLMMRRLRACGILSFSLLLSACATAPQLPPDELDRVWQQHRESLEQQQDWTIVSRIAASTEDDAWSGKLSWRQIGENYQMHFQAPFGQGAAQLSGGPAYVEMHTSDGQVLIAEDAETLLFQQLGWRLPLTGLRYWVLGLPMPVSAEDAEPTLTLDEVGRLAAIRQSRWQVRYEGYQQVSNLALPAKIYLENSVLNLRLVIDRWQLNAH